MKYVYSKFDGIDFFFFRIGGSGLGNLLYPFFRALIHAKNNNLKIISPTFKSFKIGPYLRKENQKRLYDYNYENSIGGFMKLWLLLFSNKVLIFESFGDGFKSLYGHEDFLKEKLKSLVKEDYDEEKYKESICCHIRLGDFKLADNNEIKNNTRLPIIWYKDMINYLRKDNHNMKVYLFSDGKKSELIEILKLGNVFLETSINPIIDILKLSCSKYLIGSYSSFSFWAAFFSKAECYWHKSIFNNEEFPQNSNNFQF